MADQTITCNTASDAWAVLADLCSGRIEPFQTGPWWVPYNAQPVIRWDVADGVVTMGVQNGPVGEMPGGDYTVDLIFPLPENSLVGWLAFFGRRNARVFAYQPNNGDNAGWTFVPVRFWRQALLTGCFSNVFGPNYATQVFWHEDNYLSWGLDLRCGYAEGQFALDVAGYVYDGHNFGPDTLGRDIWSWEDLSERTEDVAAIHAAADGLRRSITGVRALVTRHDGKVLLEGPAPGLAAPDLERLPTLDSAVARLANAFQTWGGGNLVMRGLKGEQVDLRGGLLIPGGEDEP